MKARKLFARTLLAVVLAVGLLPSVAFAGETGAQGEGAVGAERIALDGTSAEGAAFKAAETAASDDGALSKQAIGEPAVVDEQAGSEASARVANGKLYVLGGELYDYAYQVLDLVNQQRAANGLGALTMDAELLEAAMARAAECSVYFSHTRPDGSQCFSISNRMYGENIAAGQWDPAMVMDSWMNSPGHRSNILNSRWNSIGIGCFVGADGVLYWTQAFGEVPATPVSQPANGLAAWSVYIDSSLVPVSMQPLLVDAAGTPQQPPMRLNVGDEGDVVALCRSSSPESFSDYFYAVAESFAWTCSNPKVLSIDEHGHVTAGAAGTAHLTAVSGVFSMSFDVTVGFADVVPGQWYEGAVQFASQEGLISGYGGTANFGVGDPVTRAQLATILWRYAEPEEAAAYQNVAQNLTGLSDVAANSWYTAAANWAVENHVVNGAVQPDGTRAFDPDGTVTREQLALILANFNGVDSDAYPTGSLESFPDAAEVDGWAAGGLAWAVDSHVVNGSSEGGVLYLRPTGAVTREQAATVLMNAIQGGVL